MSRVGWGLTGTGRSRSRAWGTRESDSLGLDRKWARSAACTSRGTATWKRSGACARQSRAAEGRGWNRHPSRVNRIRRRGIDSDSNRRTSRAASSGDSAGRKDDSQGICAVKCRQALGLAPLAPGCRKCDSERCRGTRNGLTRRRTMTRRRVCTSR